MKLKSFMLEVHEYLDSLVPMSDAAYVNELVYKYSITGSFAQSLLEEWKRERRGV